MGAEPILIRVAATAAFLLCGGYCLVRCAVDDSHGRRGKFGNGAHAIMCAAMIGMIWWPVRLAGFQMTFFAIAGGWFVLDALGLTGVPLTLAGRQRHATGRHAGGVRLRCAHHAVMMGAMSWMYAGAASAAPAGSMPGMSMPGVPSGMSMPMVGSSWLTVGVGVYFVVAASVLVMSILANVGRGPTPRAFRDDAMYAVMSTGMGLVLLVSI